MKILLSLVLMVLSVHATYALGSNITFWRTLRRFPCAGLPAPAFSLRGFAGMLLRTWRAQVIEGFFIPGSIYLRLRFRNAATQHPPIILVHGIYQNQASWFIMQKALYAAGFASTCYNYRSFFTSMETVCDGLEKEVQLQERRFPGIKPVIMGHSLGGLVARAWVQRPGNAERLSALLTFGTPHEGSLLAPVAPGKLATLLRPGSPFLQNLAKNHTPPPFPAYAFSSPTDEAVQPPRSLLPPAGWQLCPTGHYSHLGMLFAKDVIAAAIAVLKTLPKQREQV